MKLVRNYLLDNELQEIVVNLVKEKSAIAREIMQVGMVCQFLCDEIEEFETCNDIYNQYIKQDEFDLDLDVKNYYLINYCVEEELGIGKIVEQFLTDISQKIDEINIDEFTNKLQEFKGVLNGTSI